MTTKKVVLDYSKLSQELTDLMAQLETGELDIDAAVASYERGLAIVKMLEDHLLQAENHVSELRDATSAAGAGERE